MSSLADLIDSMDNIMMEGVILDALRGMGCEVYHTGSQEICDPPPPISESDDDYLVYIDPKKSNEVLKYLMEEGFTTASHLYEPNIGESGFLPLKKEHLNLILTQSKDWKEKHILATKVCKKLNLLRKEDRIMVFEAVLFGVDKCDNLSMLADIDKKNSISTWTPKDTPF